MKDSLFRSVIKCEKLTFKNNHILKTTRVKQLALVYSYTYSFVS